MCKCVLACAHMTHYTCVGQGTLQGLVLPLHLILRQSLSSSTHHWAAWTVLVNSSCPASHPAVGVLAFLQMSATTAGDFKLFIYFFFFMYTSVWADYVFVYIALQRRAPESLELELTEEPNPGPL